MVCERLMPRSEQTSNKEVNCAPLSVVMTDGTPKREIHEERSACAQTTAVIEDRGTTSGHLEVLSIMVRTYVNP